MDVLFYTEYKRHISITTVNVKPMAVIRTDSYLEIPHCEITLSDDYKKLIPIARFVSFTDDDKIYQVTEIETQITTDIQYVIKADEIFSSVLSRRITIEDTIFCEVYNEPKEISQALYSLVHGQLYPPLASGASTFSGAIEYDTTADTEHAKAECIWEAGSSLFDYLQKEADAHRMYIDFQSRLERDGFLYHITASATLRSYTEKPKIFLPSNDIVNITITEPLFPEYTEISFDETLHIRGSSFNARYQGKIMPDYYNPNYPTFDSNIRNTVTNVKQKKGDSNILSGLNLNSLTRYINNSASQLSTQAVSYITGGIYYRYEGEEAGITYEYIYAYSNTSFSVKSTNTGEDITVKGLTIACASEVTYTAIKNYYSLLKNGHFDNYLRTRMNGGKAEGEKTLINGRYFYVMDIFVTDTDTDQYTPLSSDYFCISKIKQDDKEESAIKNADYIFPISLVAVEQKLLSDFPKTEKDITVEFSEEADAEMGDEIQIIAGRSLFYGVVTAEIETWENGTYKRDFEVKEWTQEN